MDSSLQQNILAQSKRLIQQLEEIEELKGELDQEEYEQMKKDSLEQLQQFQKGLDDMDKNNLSLKDTVQQAKADLHKYVSKSFNIENVKQNMSNQSAQGQRTQIETIERNFQLNKISEQDYIKHKLLLIQAIQNLKAPLTSEELSFLNSYSGSGSFHQVEGTNQINNQNLLNQAEKQIQNNQLK